MQKEIEDIMDERFDPDYISFARQIREKLIVLTCAADIRLVPVMKTNGVYLLGICIDKQKGNLSPTVYLESYYEEYKNNLMSIDSITASIQKIMVSSEKDQSIDLAWYTDFSLVKDRVRYKIINRAMNKELLENIHKAKGICRGYNPVNLIVFCNK